MSVPSAVKKQSAEAVKLFEETYGEEPSLKEVPEAEETVDVSEESPDEGSPESEDSQKEVETTEEVVAEAAPKPEQDYWKNRFDVLQGKYNAEVPRMSQQISELTEKIESLKAKPEEPKTYVTPEQVEEYGQDFVEFGRSVAREEIQTENDRLRSEIADLQAKIDGIEGRHQQSEQDRFYMDLNAKVPNWEQLNTDPEFLSWLGTVDPYAGASRHLLLKSAYDSMDADRVAYFFTSFTDSKPKPVEPQAELEKQVAPPKKAKGTNAPPAKPVYTISQINQFYKDKKLGKFAGREEEAGRIEADIFAAQNEGRISH